MILNCSGRCDIVAFYSKWFIQRVEAGFIDVRNPYYPSQVSRILIKPDTIDAICFCTKNPHPILPFLDLLTDYPLIFQVTITPYGKEIESVKEKKRVIEDVITLSRKLGKSHVIVRYDPIFISKKYSISYHTKALEKLLSQLEGNIDTVIISFLDYKKNTRNHLKEMGVIPFTEDMIHALCENISHLAKKYQVSFQTCCEDIDLSRYGMKQVGCINSVLMEKILGYHQDYVKGHTREGCHCIQTVDIGFYNCCPHFCKYCYANYEEDQVLPNFRLHHEDSSFLIGEAEEGDMVTIRKDDKKRQITFPI